MEPPPDMFKFDNPCPGQANSLPGYFFTQALQMLLASHCLIGNPDDYPKDYGNSIMNNDEFDFIIVGGGSAGSVIASRLSEVTKWRILLIEAGGNPTFESDIPGFSLSLPGRDLDWKFTTNKTERSCLGMEDEVCSIFQGKVLGGTSTINKMHYFRGNRLDYDEWSNLGNSGWDYDNVLNYFKKSEKLHEDFTLLRHTDYEENFKNLKEAADNDYRRLHEISKMVPGKYHSKAGMLNINHFAYDYLFSRVKRGLCSAAEELDVPFVADVNGKSQIGYVRAMGTIHEANRGNSAKSFLSKAKNRENLFVLKDTIVQKLIINEGKVLGVKIVRNKTEKVIMARKEVVLSAGAINSPRLMLLSGIGPKKRLLELGIAVVKDLPGVGENMQMHVSFLGLPFIIDKGRSISITHLQKLDAMYQFVSRGIGFFGNVGLNDLVGFVNTAKNSSIPDIQYFHYLNIVRDYYTFNELLISLKVRNDIRDQYSKAYAKSNVFLMCPTLLKPKSRGRIELTGPNFNDPPKITSNLLQEKEDVETLIRGIRFGIKLTKTQSFEEFQPELIKLQITGCRYLDFGSDEYWECLLRHLGTSMHDVAGTCKMGPDEDPMSVVDKHLKVYGVEGLRIADSSIMPSIVRGSTAVAAVMIGEKVSDMIKEDWKKEKNEEL